MELAFFRVQIREEIPDPIDHIVELLGRQFANRNIQRDPAGPCSFLEIVQIDAIARFCPRLDRALVE